MTHLVARATRAYGAALCRTGDLARIDHPDLYWIVMRLLLRSGWRDSRAPWPTQYIRTATHRAGRQYYIRHLQQQRQQDEMMHVDVESPAMDQLDVEPTTAVTTPGIDTVRFLDGLRAAGRTADCELADVIGQWLDGASRTQIGNAKYVWMLGRLRTPRLRARWHSGSGSSRWCR